MADYQSARGAVRAGQDVRGYQGRDSYETSLEDLRRQQAEFQNLRRDFDDKYGWMATPALAPEFLLMGPEAVAALMLQRAAPRAAQVLNFLNREPNLINGDTITAQIGRRAHLALKAKVDAKPGWKYEPWIRTPEGKLLKPDVRAPERYWGAKPTRFQMDLKPDTASGRKAGQKAVQKYQDGTGNKTRAIFYDPEDYR